MDNNEKLDDLDKNIEKADDTKEDTKEDIKDGTKDDGSLSIDMDYILKTATELLKIPSPTGFTDMAMYFVEQELKKFNIKYNHTKKGAIMAFLPGRDNSYKKMISAHVDTLGALVQKIKSNGRLEITNLGGYAWGSVEGENVKIQTIDDRLYDGTLLPTKASVHIYSDDARNLPRTQENMEVRIDEDVKNDEDVKKLGIKVGDLVLFDPRTRFTDSGYVKSRYLDDKICVAQILGYIKFLFDNKLKPFTDLYIYFSNYEEIGHGVSVYPNGLNEFIALDIGLAGPDADGDEKKVSICIKDNKTVYDRDTRLALMKACDDNDINYTIGIYNRYGSDASVAILQGFDFKFACIGPNVDATHHYERTHMDGIAETVKLMLCYL